MNVAGPANSNTTGPGCLDRHGAVGARFATCRIAVRTPRARLGSRDAKSLLRDERGAVMMEYVVIIGFVALGSIPALLFCAWALAQNFAYVRDYALYPFP